MLSNKKLGFLGGGNMAQAIVKGLIAASFIEPKNILISDINAARLESLRNDFKVKTSQVNREVAEKTDIIILAVKPQAMETVLEELGGMSLDKKLFISVAAGVSIQSIESVLKGGVESRKAHVIRTMPNTPALALAGVTAIAPGSAVSKMDMKIAHRLFEAVGQTVDVPESQLDAVTGLSGSGPAYVFTIIEALSDGGVKMGLARDVARTLAVQTVLGAAQLAQESGKHTGELKDMVTSPAGTTIAGIKALEKGALRATLMDAVEQATLRSIELGKR